MERASTCCHANYDSCEASDAIDSISTSVIFVI